MINIYRKALDLIKLLTYPYVKLCLLCMCFSTFFLSACTIAENIKKEEENTIHVDYSAKQMLLIASSRKKHISDFYSADIWSLHISDDYASYKDVFTEEMQIFFVQLKVMNSMAVDMGHGLSSKEAGDIKDVAKAFYEKLKGSSSSLKDMSYEELEAMFLEYATALKLRKSLSDDENLEVSENDARIMHLQRIILADRESADRIYAEVNAEGADFATIAKANSTDKEISLKVGHEDLNPAVDSEVSLLGDGQISKIIEIEGSFHIYKCILGYDKEATASKKLKLQNKRIDEKLTSSYNQYFLSKKVDMDDKAWEKMLVELDTMDIDKLDVDFMDSFQEANIW